MSAEWNSMQRMVQGEVWRCVCVWHDCTHCCDVQHEGHPFLIKCKVKAGEAKCWSEETERNEDETSRPFCQLQALRWLRCVCVVDSIGVYVCVSNRGRPLCWHCMRQMQSSCRFRLACWLRLIRLTCVIYLLLRWQSEWERQMEVDRER